MVLLIAVGGAAYYQYVYHPRHTVPPEPAYVLPNSLEVVDTPAEVRMVVGRLRSGERVEVLLRSHSWTKVRFAEGQTGWVEAKNLVDAQTYDGGQQLLKEIENLSPQAVGHTSAMVNLRLEPSRDAPQLAQLEEKQRVEVFGRRLVEREAVAAATPSSTETPQRDAWYQIRANTRAGWVLGRLVTLDVPEELAEYAQSVNLVAWLVLSTVEDGGQQVPQYLAADRRGTQEFDFNHIRVFTWWTKRHRYVTAYVESNLNGYLPIRVWRVGNVPYFRLRLVDREGHKFQKVYRLFDTITRPVGTVEGWESDALPASAAPRRRRARGR